jgi:cellulose synthase/poly-beta-1,6-N-acetylglucosamine synthase-like glycosyltransferase
MSRAPFQPQPLVSVVMPAYNAALYLEDAVRSLQSQTYTHLHIIIVNDGSKDNRLKSLTAWPQKTRVSKLFTRQMQVYLLPEMMPCVQLRVSTSVFWTRTMPIYPKK